MYTSAAYLTPLHVGLNPLKTAITRTHASLSACTRAQSFWNHAQLVITDCRHSQRVMLQKNEIQSSSTDIHMNIPKHWEWVVGIDSLSQKLREIFELLEDVFLTALAPFFINEWHPWQLRQKHDMIFLVDQIGSMIRVEPLAWPDGCRPNLFVKLLFNQMTTRSNTYLQGKFS